MLKRPNRAILRPAVSADYTDYSDFGQGLKIAVEINQIVWRRIVSDRPLSMIQAQNEICVICVICGSFRLLNRRSFTLLLRLRHWVDSIASVAGGYVGQAGVS